MQEPLLSDDPFLADVQAARSQPGLHLWWLGQSGFLLNLGIHCALLDPYLSDSLTKKYANTDKPHVRMTRRVVDPLKLDFINVAASTHNHTDHLDAQTLVPLLDVNPDLVLIVPEANRLFAADRLGLDPEEIVGINERQTIAAGRFSFTAVPAAHETVERDAAGRPLYVGYIIRAGQWTIYHSGDTVLYDDMANLLRPFQIDLALLPINGRAPERRVAGNLTGLEAARLAHDIGAKRVIPCHYDMFEFNTASPPEFVAECERIGQTYQVLRNGERMTLNAER